MARKKPKGIKPVGSFEQMNGSLGELAGLKRQLEKIESDLNEAIDKLKEEAAAKAASILERIKALEGGMQAFAELKKDVFDKKRSKTLAHGTIGFRKSKELKPKPKMTWAKVLEKLKALGFKDGIRVKESVDKEELKKWTDEKLALVGVRRVPKDDFWYEIDEEKIAEKAAA